MRHLTIEYKYSGRWVAIKNLRVVESGDTLDEVKAKIQALKNNKSFRYMYVPNGVRMGGFIVPYGAFSDLKRPSPCL